MKTPSLQQIADLIRSLGSAKEKLAVELSAFSGRPWGRYLITSGLSPFPEYVGQLRRNGMKIEPVQLVPTPVTLHFLGSERKYVSFLCAEGCWHLYETFVQAASAKPPAGKDFLLYDPDTSKPAEERMRERDLEPDGLERYFRWSLFDARRAGMTDLNDDEISFMLGEIEGYDLIEREDDEDAQIRIIDRLRTEYARIQGKYFSTARFSEAEKPLDLEAVGVGYELSRQLNEAKDRPDQR